MWNILVQCRLRALLLLIVLVALAALQIASGLPAAGTSDGKYSSHLIHVPHSTSGPCSDDADGRTVENVMDGVRLKLANLPLSVRTFIRRVR